MNKYNVTYDATVYSADGEAQTLKLTADDLQIVGNATNVGTYQVKLSQAGQEKLKQLTGNNGANYKWTFKTTANYIVTAATADAKLNGSNQKTFDGTAVTTAQVNSNGQILVHFTFPGSTTESTYALQDGDYIWNAGSAPVNAGTYTIKLSANGIVNLQKALNQYAGQGNVTLDAEDLLGSATYTIKQKDLNVVLDGNSKGADGKTYDGQPATINTQATNFGVFTPTGLVSGETLNTANLAAGDYEWVDANGKPISAPTNAGTYYIALTAKGLKKLQDDNPNYAVSESGQFTYVISPAEENVTISGSQESTVPVIDGTNFKVNVPTVTVRVEHDTIIVTPETPPRDVPTGPVPGDPSKNYDHLDTLTKTPTRIITVITPSGAKLITTQKVTFTRTATFDKVTGKVTYSEWKVNGSAQWDVYTAPTFSGYTASQSEVAAEKVSVDTADSNIEITYKQDEVPTPEPKPDKPAKPNKESEKKHNHSKANKKGYDSNNNPKKVCLQVERNALTAQLRQQTLNLARGQ